MPCKFENQKKLSKAEYSLCQRILRGRIILDIDLDFFIDFMPDEKEIIPTILVPKNERMIIEEISAINKLFSYAGITTIATSPELFCGEDGRRYLAIIQNIFAKHFLLPINFMLVTAEDCLASCCT